MDDPPRGVRKHPATPSVRIQAERPEIASLPASIAQMFRPQAATPAEATQPQATPSEGETHGFERRATSRIVRSVPNSQQDSQQDSNRSNQGNERDQKQSRDDKEEKSSSSQRAQKNQDAETQRKQQQHQQHQRQTQQQQRLSQQAQSKKSMPQRPKTPSRSASEPECKAACTHCGQHLEGTSASCPACARRSQEKATLVA